MQCLDMHPRSILEEILLSYYCMDEFIVLFLFLYFSGFAEQDPADDLDPDDPKFAVKLQEAIATQEIRRQEIVQELEKRREEKAKMRSTSMNITSSGARMSEFADELSILKEKNAQLQRRVYVSTHHIFFSIHVSNILRCPFLSFFRRF